MSNVRGLSVSLAINYIKKNFGDEGLAKVLDALDQQEREMFKGAMNPMVMYPAKAFIKLINTADKLYGGGDYDICRQIGRFEAENAFGGLYKVFLELGNPSFVIRRAPLAWRTLNDAGDLEIEQTGDKYVKGKISDYPDFDKGFCWNLLGYFEKVLEMSGAKNVNIKEVRCRCQGDAFCEYEIRWE